MEHAQWVWEIFFFLTSYCTTSLLQKGDQHAMKTNKKNKQVNFIWSRNTLKFKLLLISTSNVQVVLFPVREWHFTHSYIPHQ